MNKKLLNVVIFLGLLSSCSPKSQGITSPIRSTKFIDDTGTKADLMNFDMDYDFSEPSTNYNKERISNYWNHDTDFPFYTYDIIYQASDEKYYCLYLKTDLISEITNFLTAQDPAKINELGSKARFTAYSESSVIDGKYLYGYQKKNSSTNADDFGILIKDSLDEIPYDCDGYTLVMVTKRKTLTYVENMTSETQLNQSIYAYVRYPAEFNVATQSIERSTKLDNSDGQKESEEDFALEGEYMEYDSIETITGSTTRYYPYPRYCSSHNEQKIITEDGVRYVYLPRYRIKIQNGASTRIFDYLKDDYSQIDWFDPEDFDGIYDGYQSHFLSALHKDAVKEEAPFSYSTFRLDEVKRIVAGKVEKETKEANSD